MKIKERRRQFEKNYWKLKPIERLDYLEHLREIEKDYPHINLYELFKIYFGMFLFGFIFMYGLIYFYGNGIVNFRETTEPLFRAMIKYMFFPIIFYISFALLNHFALKKKLRKLNKIFRLEDKN